ncbi:molybdenum cofactor guanylyltransferase [Rhodovulum bhavnagarense]|uniref:Molybdenum cofactor guanylyltransferase n=1 Tax=Rhodovulum bhavnagarense TaxID=992286 RepID=A0A4R2RIT2_9RHOB|nr:molybdenum cofactor guanylyltransferase MobA [Rhodovulum bhavnagarense]TCP62754.1 molybdenum cofactor guanylyltransferase [Rhodovulum bhavnagarense]
MAVLGLILAGGQGRRMDGADKALLRLGSDCLLTHVAARLGPQVAGLALSANGDPSRFAGFGLPVLADPLRGGLGPLAGILAGLDWAAEKGAGRLVTVAVDTPFVPRGLVARLSRPDVSLTLAQSAGRVHPTAGLWSVELRAPLRAALAGGTRRVMEFAQAQGAVQVAFGGEGNPFLNINTPDDLAAAEALLCRG